MDRRESVRHTWQGNGECACRKGEGCSPEDRQEGEGEEGREVGRGEGEKGVGGVAFSGSSVWTSGQVWVVDMRVKSSIVKSIITQGPDLELRTEDT